VSVSIRGHWTARATRAPAARPFYAGWITDEVIGPFKGDPGSERW